MQAGVKMIEGRGKIIDPHTVSVNGKKYTVSLYFAWLRFNAVMSICPSVQVFLSHAVLGPCIRVALRAEACHLAD